MSVPKDIIRLIVLIKCKSQLSQVSKQYHNEYTLEYDKYYKFEYVRKKISKHPINYRLLHLSYHHYEQISSIFSSKHRGKLPIKYFL